MDEAAGNPANRMHPNDLRGRVGLAGAATAVTAFSVAVLGFILLEASFRTWTVGRFFQNRAQVFVDLFLVLAACSAVTLIFPFSVRITGAVWEQRSALPLLL
jgi:hypothetical protein